MLHLIGQMYDGNKLTIMPLQCGQEEVEKKEEEQKEE